MMANMSDYLDMATYLSRIGLWLHCDLDTEEHFLKSQIDVSYMPMVSNTQNYHR